MSLKMYRNVLLAVSIVILVAIIAVSNPAQIYTALLTARIELVSAALALTTFTALLRVLKWSLLLRMKFRALIAVQFFGTAVSIMTPGRVAEPTKALLLKIRNSVPVSATLPSIIWERVVDIVAIVVFAAFSLTAFAGTQFSFLGYAGVAIFSALIIILILVVSSRRFGLSVFRLVRRLPLLRRIDEGFIKNFYSIRIQRRRIITAMALALAIWLLDGLALYIVAQAFGVDVNPLTAVGVVAIATMIGVASSLPGGLGSTEIVMILLLTAYGVPNPVAVTVVFVYRFVTIWYGLFLGFVSFVYLSRKIDFSKAKSMLESGMK